MLDTETIYDFCADVVLFGKKNNLQKVQNRKKEKYKKSKLNEEIFFSKKKKTKQNKINSKT